MGRRAAEFAENAKRKAVSVPATKRRKREDISDEGSDDEEAMVPEALTRKIISQARQQQEEMESEDAPKQSRRGVSFAPAAALVTAAGAGSDDEDDDDEDAGEEEEVTAEYYEVEDVELDEGDERALDLFMGSRRPQNLADIIMQKIAQHQESAEARAPGEGEGASHLREGEQLMPELPPKVIEVYQGVGRLLSTYRSGKLPKAFKIIPQLTNWEEILYVTQPEEWRPAAMR
tara:strand:- start:24 stop:719 length:696 start_codon:yes stop_codon:yes gene_type:complete